MDQIGWYASDVKGRVFFVQLSKEISSGQKIKTVSPKKLVLEEGNGMHLEKIETEGAPKFYAYGRGRLLGIFPEFADAAQAAHDTMGFVSLGRNSRIWSRSNRPGASFIRDVSNAVHMLEQNRSNFRGESVATEQGFLLDASGTALSQILYFVGAGYPVLANIDVDRYQYLTGYDQGHVRIWDPVTEQSETLTMETANERFEKSGNDFICCIYEK